MTRVTPIMLLYYVKSNWYEFITIDCNYNSKRLITKISNGFGNALTFHAKVKCNDSDIWKKYLALT